MPYRKRRMRRYRKKNGTKRLKAIIKKTMMKTAETKFWDFNVDLNPDVNGIIVPLTDVPQGDTDVSRDGDQLRILKYSHRLSVIPADTSNLVRVIIFRWNVMSSYKAPLTTDLLAIGGAPVATIPTANYVFDNQRQRQFTILSDRLYPVALNGPAILARYQKKSMKGLPINFEASTVNAKGKLYLLAISDSSATAHPRIVGNTRIIFNDS